MAISVALASQGRVDFDSVWRGLCISERCSPEKPILFLCQVGERQKIVFLVARAHVVNAGGLIQTFHSAGQMWGSNV